MYFHIVYYVFMYHTQYSINVYVLQHVYNIITGTWTARTYIYGPAVQMAFIIHAPPHYAKVLRCLHENRKSRTADFYDRFSPTDRPTDGAIIIIIKLIIIIAIVDLYNIAFDNCAVF